MRDVLVVFLLLLCVLLLSGATRERGEPIGGYCIGNQCFAVLEDSGDFRSAQDTCSQQKGFLMTVRSSVAHDIVSLLLGNSTGTYWIGLHLPKGCPDSSTDLRGYRWVTTDTTSDFYNWAPTFDRSCSSPSLPRCVSVSKANKFQWTQDQCDHLNSGFLCEYTFQNACKGFQNTNVSYTTPYGFTVEDVLSLPPGSIAEHMDERKQVCTFRQWLQGPWSCEFLGGGCEHKCTINPENNPVCYCQPGHFVNPLNDLTCEVALDDPCLELKCEYACFKYADSFLCACNEGFTLADDRISCIDFDECLDKRQCPGDTKKCINTQGSFLCICTDGYELSGGTCVDIDECISAPCEHMCTNKAGGFECSCFEGYKADPKSPDKCKLHCGKDECIAECDPNNKFQCYCPDGFILEERMDQSFCVDIDECEFDECDHYCENLFGTYECFCGPGYTLVKGFMCEKGIGGDTEVTTVVKEVISVTVAPTHQPPAVSVGGLVGIIVCLVFFIFLAAFLIHHILCSKQKTDSSGSFKASEVNEAHSLHQVTMDIAL